MDETFRRPDIADKAVERHQHDIRVFLPERRERAMQGPLVAPLNLAGAQNPFVSGRRRIHIGEVELKQSDSAVVPVLQYIHEIIKKSAAIHGHRIFR